MAISNTIDLGAIKALSKEKRQWLASEIHKNNELWNAVNGMGGLSENSDKSRLQGTITKQGEAVFKAKVSISVKGQNEQIVMTNQNGYFSIDLEVESYTVKIFSGNDSSDEAFVETEKGVTSTLDYDFK